MCFVEDFWPSKTTDICRPLRKETRSWWSGPVMPWERSLWRPWCQSLPSALEISRATDRLSSYLSRTRKKINEYRVDERFEDFACDWEKTDWAITGGLRQVWSFFRDGHNWIKFQQKGNLLIDTFMENFGQDKRKLWRKMVEDNHWNAIRSTGLGNCQDMKWS